MTLNSLKWNIRYSQFDKGHYMDLKKLNLAQPKLANLNSTIGGECFLVDVCKSSSKPSNLPYVSELAPSVLKKAENKTVQKPEVEKVQQKKSPALRKSIMSQENEQIDNSKNEYQK